MLHNGVLKIRVNLYISREIDIVIINLHIIL